MILQIVSLIIDDMIILLMSRLHYITEIEGWWMKEEGYDNKIMFEKRWKFLGKLLFWQNPEISLI